MTGDAADGVLCMTLCDACEVTGVLPIPRREEEAARVLEHAGHVGVDEPSARRHSPCFPVDHRADSSHRIHRT